MINDQQGQHILQQFLCYHIKSNTFRDLFIPIIQHQSFRVKSTKAVEGFKGKNMSETAKEGDIRCLAILI